MDSQAQRSSYVQIFRNSQVRTLIFSKLFVTLHWFSITTPESRHWPCNIFWYWFSWIACLNNRQCRNVSSLEGVVRSTGIPGPEQRQSSPLPPPPLPNIVEQLQSRCPTSWVASPQGNLLSSRHGGWWWQPLVPGVWTIIFARAVTLFSSPISPMSPTRPRCVVILEWMVLVLSHPFHYLDRTFRRSGSRFSWQHQPSPRWWWYCIMLEDILPRFPRFRLPDTVNRPFKLDPVVSAWLDFEVGLNWTVYRFTER